MTPVKRELTDAERNGGALYGLCPEGHGDENGVIAAEVSASRRPYANCPICGRRLDTDAVSGGTADVS